MTELDQINLIERYIVGGVLTVEWRVNARKSPGADGIGDILIGVRNDGFTMTCMDATNRERSIRDGENLTPVEGRFFWRRCNYSE